MNLYAFVLNDPLRRIDLFGLWAMPTQRNYDFLNAHLEEFAHFGPGNAVRDFMYNHTRVEGGFRTFAGFGEAAFGGGLTYSTGGIGGAFGFGLMAHGLDQATAGLNQLYTGQRSYSYTEQLFHHMGMSRDWASTVSDSFGMFGSLGAMRGIYRNITFSKQMTIPKLSILDESSHNRAIFEHYKDFLREHMEKPSVSDAKLQKILDYSYRPNANIGSGSTAAAIRHEKLTGEHIQGKVHSQKGREVIRSLDYWLKNNPTARLGDRAAAENVIKDLRNALEE